MYQKSRQRWNKEGDQNKKFLYNAMKARFTNNYIASLDTNVCSVEQVNEVKVEIRKQFTNQFKDDRISRINTNVPFFYCFSAEESKKLEEPFSNEESRRKCGIVMQIGALVRMGIILNSKRSVGR